MMINLYMAKDKNGNLVLYPEMPRYSNEVSGFVCRFGEFILPKSIYKKEVEMLSASITSEEQVLSIKVEIEDRIP